MKDFYIRRGQSVKEHRIIDEGPGKHPGGVGHLSEHKEAASLAKRRSIRGQRYHGKGRVLSIGRPQRCWKSTGDDKRGSLWSVLCILCRPTDSLLNLT